MEKTIDPAKILPHRTPVLLVDRVLELEPGERVRAVKNITSNDQLFQGHFPGKPVMPGALIIEALAQASILLYAKEGSKEKSTYYLASVKADFKKPVIPGDQLVLEAQNVRMTPNGAYVEAKALVNNDIVAQADLILVIKNEQ